MAAALHISRVQSNKCWFLTTGNIFAVQNGVNYQGEVPITISQTHIEV